MAKQEKDGHEGASHSAALPKVSDFLLKCFRLRSHDAVVHHLGAGGHIAPGTITNTINFILNEIEIF